MEVDNKLLSFLKPDLVDKILKESKMLTFMKGTEILREHQSIKELPIVISGIVKVYSRFEDKELLLYCIDLLVLAVVFVLTSLISFCPLYLPFGIKTCKK
ncbi:MAG: DUF2892 domain-containing protein [Paludibacter sp.]|jgi:signal-transduction protein with cAMP-binding, CBS, and nucleotidyltransferase domain|nr:DUF2892 domain-containing protein [Paludibacter sp.]